MHSALPQKVAEVGFFKKSCREDGLGPHLEPSASLLGWNAVSDLFKSMGEVVTMHRHSEEPSSALSALVWLRPSVELPMSIELSVGMRRFPVLLKDRRSPIPLFDPQSDRFSLLTILVEISRSTH